MISVHQEDCSTHEVHRRQNYDRHSLFGCTGNNLIIVVILQYLQHTLTSPTTETCQPAGGSLETAGRVFLPEPKMRAITPVGCCSVMGVDNGVAGTDLLDVDAPPTADRVTPATAVDILSAVMVTPDVVNCRPGIGRAGGARHPNNNSHYY